MDLQRLQRRIMVLAKKKGWGTNPNDVIFAEKIALVHQEVSEALEAYRKHKMRGLGGVAEELADVVLRALHLAGIYGINLAPTITKKLARNKKRDWNQDQLYIDREKRKKNMPR